MCRMCHDNLESGVSLRLHKILLSFSSMAFIFEALKSSFKMKFLELNFILKIFTRKINKVITENNFRNGKSKKKLK